MVKITLDHLIAPRAKSYHPFYIGTPPIWCTREVLYVLLLLPQDHDDHLIVS